MIHLKSVPTSRVLFIAIIMSGVWEVRLMPIGTKERIYVSYVLIVFGACISLSFLRVSPDGKQGHPQPNTNTYTKPLAQVRTGIRPHIKNPPLSAVVSSLVR